MPDHAAAIAQAAALLGRARSAVALTGAGLSTPSGIPDFRSPQSGLWAESDPLDVASLSTFRYEPERFFAWVRPLAARVRAAQPNPAHQALAQLEAMGRLQTVLSQNIDGLHQKAGSRSVLELHGGLATVTCVRCYTRWPGPPVLDDFIATGALPRCSACGGLLKPDVTLMGEELPVGVLQAAQRSVRACDVLLVAGCSLEVMPAAGLPMEALGHAAQLILVNYLPTYVDERAAVLIEGDVAEILPRIAQAVKGSVNV
jgi:NAD-dependent deacetylase